LQQLLRSPPREAVTVRLLLALRELALLLTRPTSAQLLVLTSPVTPLSSQQTAIRTRVEFLLRVRHTLHQLSGEQLLSLAEQIAGAPPHARRQHLITLLPNLDKVLLPLFCELLLLPAAELLHVRAWVLLLESRATPALAHLLSFESSVLLDLKSKLSLSSEVRSPSPSPTAPATQPAPSSQQHATPSPGADSSAAPHPTSLTAFHPTKHEPEPAPLSADPPHSSSRSTCSSSGGDGWPSSMPMQTGRLHDPVAPVSLPLSDPLDISPPAMPEFDIPHLRLSLDPTSMLPNPTVSPSGSAASAASPRAGGNLDLFDDLLGPSAGDAGIDDGLFADLLSESGLPSFESDPLNFLNEPEGSFSPAHSLPPDSLAHTLLPLDATLGPGPGHAASTPLSGTPAARISPTQPLGHVPVSIAPATVAVGSHSPAVSSFTALPAKSQLSLRLVMAREPPPKTVYQRILKPYPSVMVDIWDPSSSCQDLSSLNLFVEVCLLRADSDGALPECLEGNRVVRLGTGVFATFTKLKILSTSQQQGTLFRLRFRLKR
jgi:hypothetical protein